MYKKLFSLVSVAASLLATAQQKPQDTIVLSSVNAVAKLPITKEIIGKKQIQKKNLGQDMPVLLKNATAVISTSDAGAGVGYTGMRIRGIAAEQVNVTFNGVPVNDSESQGVFWVDFPDVSSSADAVVIQRGVGTSSNGAASFGGSINLDTNRRRTKSFGELMGAYGSFNTQKYMLSAGTGDVANQKLNFDVRGSYVKSDGYRDRASADLYSVGFNARYMPSANTEIHLLNIFGHEKTYQAWDGITKSEEKKYGRTYNPNGAIFNSDWSNVISYYDNHVDNYDQNHTHLYWNQKYANGWKSKFTAHYTRGKGYYESYKQGAKLAKSYKVNINGLPKADAIRRKWLDNHFYGGIFNVENTQLGNTKLYAGVAANKYVGDHYGEIIKVINHPEYKQNGYYYENEANKVEISGFVKFLQKIGKVDLFGDVQIRNISYDGKYKNGGENDAEEFRPFDESYNFLNPKAGITFNINNFENVYFSYGLTHREPKRADILNAIAEQTDIKPETLHDFELGYRIEKPYLNLGVNAYYMRYKDQLVLSGKLNQVGSAIKENVGDSYRAGLEMDFRTPIVYNQLNFFGNLAWSVNKNIDYKEIVNKKVKNFGTTTISFSPNIVSSVGVEFTPVKDLNFTFVNKYVSEQYVTNTQNENLKLDAYNVSDLSANYTFKLQGRTSLELMALVNNIFNEQYASNGSKDWSGDDLRYYPQAGTNFLAGLKLKF
ncbi:TonB-dependent receptor [Ornithobacterium rhinotracheale]|uniref:TonB-dependent receptor n=1 Tax=Ornithobacterium rhinotracheale TaxID=28251 RepID=UPI00129C2690|nr:TonB-dependent receptor [Ornithobacterium rhinotracheale]MRI63452.1 TonB-dependent receptor [Ornithobacterium rhinotracheale]